MADLIIWRFKAQNLRRGGEFLLDELSDAVHPQPLRAVAEVERPGVTSVDQAEQGVNGIPDVKPRSRRPNVGRDRRPGLRRGDERRQRTAPIARLLPGSIEHVEPDDAQPLLREVEPQGFLAPTL